jgi:hypothetical protein
LSPEDADRLKAQVEEARKGVVTAQANVQTKVDEFRSSYPAKLHFDYKYDAKLAEKMGIHSMYTDGKFFFVSASPTETPTLYEIKDGKPSLIAFEFKDGLYSTARVIDQGYLAVGGNGNGKHQEKLPFRRAVEAN